MKAWLERNKIYFELTSSILFGGAALVISFAAHNMSEAQLDIARISTLPHFYLESIYQRNSETNNADDEILRVQNVGAPAYNVSVENLSFIKFENYRGSSTPVYLWVIYYFATIQSANPTGLITTHKQSGNNKDFSRIYNEAMEASRSRRHEYLFADLVTLTTVSYRDALNNVRAEFFLDKDKISESEAAPFLNLAKKMSPQKIHALTLDAMLDQAKPLED